MYMLCPIDIYNNIASSSTAERNRLYLTDIKHNTKSSPRPAGMISCLAALVPVFPSFAIFVNYLSQRLDCFCESCVISRRRLPFTTRFLPAQSLILLSTAHRNEPSRNNASLVIIPASSSSPKHVEYINAQPQSGAIATYPQGCMDGSYNGSQVLHFRTLLAPKYRQHRETVLIPEHKLADEDTHLHDRMFRPPGSRRWMRVKIQNCLSLPNPPFVAICAYQLQRMSAKQTINRG